MTNYCTNCGGDGYTVEAPVCPACNGTGKSQGLVPRRSSLTPNQLLQLGRDTLLKVGTLGRDATTMQVVLEGGRPPGRTTVRTYDALAVASMVEPSDRIMAAYQDAYRR